MDRITHASAIDIGGGRRGFRSKDTVAGVPGTVATATWLNAVQEEIMAVLEAIGLVGSNADLKQLLRAIRSQRVNYLGAFTGTGDALSAAPALAFTSLGDMFQVPLIGLLPASANATVAPALTINGFTAPVLRRDGTAPVIGDIAPGQYLGVFHDGTAFRSLFPLALEIPRNIPSPTIYVRPGGNDANDGSANTDAKALQTINAAIARATQVYNLAGRNLLIKLGVAGTYAPFTIQGAAGLITIEGDVAAQDSYVISGVKPGFVSGANLVLKGLQLANTATTDHTLEAGYGGVITLDRMTFGGTGSTNVATAHMLANPGGSIVATGNIKIQSNQGSAMFARGGNITVQNGLTVTFSGGPSFALATAAARGSGANIGLLSTTMAGAATGQRYSLALNGVIDTGAGPTFIPGTVAGIVNSGGQYT